MPTSWDSSPVVFGPNSQSQYLSFTAESPNHPCGSSRGLPSLVPCLLDHGSWANQGSSLKFCKMESGEALSSMRTMRIAAALPDQMPAACWMNHLL